MSSEDTTTNIIEETIYNPYNDNNKEITHNIIIIYLLRRMNDD